MTQKTRDYWRQQIKMCSQACEEIGLGDSELDASQLDELEEKIGDLLEAIAGYRNTTDRETE